MPATDPVVVDELIAAGARGGELAAAGYMRPHGASELYFSGISLLRVEAGQIAEITSFSAALCKGFELPMRFSPPGV